MAVDRTTVDLAAYPNLVMILLGMRVNTATGIKTLLGFGPQIAKAARDVPDGLLSHETFLWSLFPLHAGIRQYWRDFEALEAWSRSEPHRAWWISFLRNSGGTGFWHETYFLRGGIEAVFDDMPKPIGLLRFAPRRAAKGGMFTARQRAAATNAASFTDGQAPAPVVAEDEIDDKG
ncbi:MAG: DUF4188 domain-containing protein [Xanthobacteraceae bacterium]